MAFRWRPQVSLRLPQDVTDGDRRGVPDLGALTSDVDTYARIHIDALRSGQFDARAGACWGLVARGAGALTWVIDEISSGQTDRISDAAGVLRWVGAPADWEPWLRSLVESLPDGEPADALIAVLENICGLEPSEPSPAAGDLLLGGTRLPFTEPIWFVNDTFERVVSATRSWLDGLDNDYSFSDLEAPLPVTLDRLEPWSMPSWKQLLVATSGDWTAVFSQGSDIYTSNVVGRMLGCRSLRTNYQRRAIRSGQTLSHGDCAFWLLDSGRPVRTIQATFQSRWGWHLDGEPQPFEDLEAYNARRIADRFPLHRLNEYCAALGIARNDADFYLPTSTLIEEDTRTWVHYSTNRMRAADWRAAHT